MTALESAWEWYRAIRFALELVKRLGKTDHWDKLPPNFPLFKHDDYKQVKGQDLEERASVGTRSIDELAVVHLFAAFEGSVRQRVGTDVDRERGAIKHPALQFAADEALGEIRRGSFAKVLRLLKSIDPNLVEEVRQVRIYRNWISHGRSESESAGVPRVEPKDVYDRLRRFLDILEEQASSPNPDDRGMAPGS